MKKYEFHSGAAEQPSVISGLGFQLQHQLSKQQLLTGCRTAGKPSLQPVTLSLS